MLAKFSAGEKEYRVGYDVKGNWQYTICTYTEKQMDRNLRAAVKTTYYDYTITLVQSIDKPRDRVTYLVHLENDTEILKLIVTDENMQAWQKISKSE